MPCRFVYIYICIISCFEFVHVDTGCRAIGWCEPGRYKRILQLRIGRPRNVQPLIILTILYPIRFVHRGLN